MSVIAVEKIIMDMDMNLTARNLFLLIFKLSRKNGFAWPTQNWLANNLKISRRTISYCLKKLVSLGLLEIEKNPGYACKYWPKLPKEKKQGVRQICKPHCTTPVQNLRTPSYIENINKENLSRENLENKKPVQNADRFFSSGVKTGMARFNFVADYPGLAKINFGQSQINQLYQRLVKAGLTPEEITGRLRLSLKYANFALQRGLKDKHGQPVLNPKGYVFKALTDGGNFTKPKDFKTAEDIGKEQEVLRQKKRQKAKQIADEQAKVAKITAENERFESWVSGLSQEFLSQEKLKWQLDLRSSYMSFKFWLRVYYINSNKMEDPGQ